MSCSTCAAGWVVYLLAYLPSLRWSVCCVCVDCTCVLWWLTGAARWPHLQWEVRELSAQSCAAYVVSVSPWVLRAHTGGASNCNITSSAYVGGRVPCMRCLKMPSHEWEDMTSCAFQHQRQGSQGSGCTAQGQRACCSVQAVQTAAVTVAARQAVITPGLPVARVGCTDVQAASEKGVSNQVT